MNKTLEEKLEERHAQKELAGILPSYGDTIIIIEAKKEKIMCKVFGHKQTLHHNFYVRDTKKGKERYEVYICKRCSNCTGKLVHIAKGKDLEVDCE